jgi:hypothetical protein
MTHARLLAAITALALCTSVRAQLGWQQAAVPGPSIRHSPGLAYDSARGVVVLFGGLDGDERGTATLLGDTWEWNGAQWTLCATSGPTPRMGHAMVYDSLRQVVVLFGGSDGQFRGDTWEWDGRTWRQVASAGPSARSRHGMAFDSRRGVIVLFGRIPREDNETWEWDGSSWRSVATVGPSPRSRSPLAFDAARGVTVMFGGRDPSGPGLDDTWEWDGSSWTLVASGGPSARSRHGLVYDAARGVVRLHGGLGGRGTWEWDGAMWREVATVGPPSRMYLGMAHHEARGATLVFGGWSGSAALNDTWEYAATPPCGMPVAFGCGTPHCDGLARLSAATCPRVGETAFAIEVSNGLPDAPGAVATLLSLGLTPAPGAALACDGPQGHLCYNLVPIGVDRAVAIDARGRGSLAVPIPNAASLRGASVYFQLVSAHVAQGCPCVLLPGLGLTSSRGLEAMIR